jgi:nucleoside-triphosphatase
MHCVTMAVCTTNMKILLTGEPGVGKSTLLSLVIDAVEQKQGFLTSEMSTDGIRTGFNMTASSGESFVLASVDSPSEIRVSRYGVNLNELNEFIAKLPAIEPGKLIYVDEIGQMQLYSNLYRDLVTNYFNQPNPMIGTLSKIYNDDFTESLRERSDIEIIEVTIENRDRLKEELTSRVAK